MEKILIVGAGGFGKEVVFLIERMQKYSIIGFLDDSFVENSGSQILGYDILGPIKNIADFPVSTNVVIAIANPKAKEAIFSRILGEKKFEFPNLIDPTSLMGREVHLGMGNIIMPYTTLTACISLGNFNMINIHSTIGHDDTLGSFNTIFPNSNVAGDVEIGNGVEIGTGSQILPGLILSSKSRIGSGAVVTKSVLNGITVVGVPARAIRKREK